MNGVRYLLDTNFVLGLVKGYDGVVERLASLGLAFELYGYSSITRMEALGFPKIVEEEATAIAALFGRLAYFGITPDIEDAAIHLRQRRNIKLPDAIIAATAHVHGLTLLTLDKDLIAVMASYPLG